MDHLALGLGETLVGSVAVGPKGFGVTRAGLSRRAEPRGSLWAGEDPARAMAGGAPPDRPGRHGVARGSCPEPAGERRGSFDPGPRGPDPGAIHRPPSPAAYSKIPRGTVIETTQFGMS